MSFVSARRRIKLTSPREHNKSFHTFSQSAATSTASPLESSRLLLERMTRTTHASPLKANVTDVQRLIPPLATIQPGWPMGAV